MKKRLLGILLSFALMLTIMPVLGLSQTAHAAGPVKWGADTSFDSDASFESGVDVTNNITITIAEGKTVTVDKGIYADGKTLTVEGNGNLIVSGSNSQSGSGGSAFTGNIIVNGGEVTLTGGEGNLVSENDSGGNGIEGNVEVRGGSFSATGGNGHKVGQAVRSSNTITCGNDIVAQESANGSEWSDISDYRSNKQYVRTIQTYPLWVGGTRVTSDKLSGEGWSYTPADSTTDPATPATLTLNGYSHTGAGYSTSNYNAAIYAGEDLIISLTGNNTVTNVPESGKSSYGIMSSANLTITGNGTITAKGGDTTGSSNNSTGISVSKSLTIDKDVTVKADGGNCDKTQPDSAGWSTGVYCVNDMIVNGKLEAKSGYGRTSRGIRIFNVNNGLNVGSGGNVNATAGEAYQHSYGIDSTILTIDGTVKATGGKGERISCGAYCASKLIVNGTLEANGGVKGQGSNSYSAGVYMQSYNADNLTISGTVTAKGNDFALMNYSNDSGSWTFSAIEYTVPEGQNVTESVNYDGTNVTSVAVGSKTATTSKYVKVEPTPLHTHDFTYTASGTTITATCANTDGNCTLPEVGGKHTATLTIAAPLHTTYGDGNTAAAQITDANSVQGNAKVQYQKKTGESYGTATENPPTDAGTYMASITLGTGNNSATASVEYTIAQKPVTVTGITAENKEYDGNTAAILNFNSAAISGKESGDNVGLSTTSATGAFSDKKAENGKTVTITGLALTGANASNYVLSSQPTTTANITKKAVTVTGITAEDKEYDGNTNATANCEQAVINGKLDSDDLSFTAPAGSFSDKNVDTDKTVSFNGLELTGSDSANYTLSGQPADTKASITAKPVTITGVTAEDKVYDGNRTATVITASAAIDGIVDSENVSFVKGTGSFSDKNVGNNKTVSFSDFTLTGNDSANYTLSAQPADTTAAITAKSVKVSGIKAGNKTYDGTTDATLDCTSASFDSRVGDDNLTVTATGTFADANVGTSKTVSISGLTLGGDSKGNYILASEGQQTTAQADIAQKSIAGAAVTLDKTQLTYNGQEQSVSVTGVTTSDGMTLTANDYEIVTGNTGTDIGDYTVTIEGKGNFKDTATADWKIVEKAMTVKAENVTVTYDGKEHGIKVEVIDPASGAEVKYGTKEGTYDLEESPTIKEPGTLTVYYRVTAGSNYSVYTGKAVVTVNKPAEIISAEQAVVKGVSKGKTSLKFTWNKVDKAASYEVWMAKCGKKMKKVKTLGASKTSWTKKKLKRRTAYKFYVVAKDSSGNVISRSLTGHAITGNVRGRYTNAKSLSVSQSSINLNKGGTAKISATQKKAKKGKKLCKHEALLRYTSNNPAVATVDSNGTVTGVSAGSCVVYVQTVNGIWKTVDVSVN